MDIFDGIERVFSTVMAARVAVIVGEVALELFSAAAAAKWKGAGSQVWKELRIEQVERRWRLPR